MATSWFATHWLAVVLFSAYAMMLVYNAVRGAKEAGVEGYYVGGRNLGGWVIGISFFATFASTNSYIGHAGKAWELGLPWLVFGNVLVLFTWVSWRYVAPRMRLYSEQLQALTLPDYLGARFVSDPAPQHPLRLFSALIIVFSSVLYLIAIFKGAGHLFQLFFDLSYAAAVGVTLVIVMLYTSVGGFVSVVRTDAVQGMLMLLGCGLLFYFVSQAAGGVSALWQLADRPETAHLFTLDAGMPFVVLIGIALSGAMKLLVDPRQLSRFFALKDDTEVRRGLWVSLLGLLFIFACLLPLGMYARLILADVQDTDLVVPTLVANAAIFPVWAADFLMVAIVAAAMSSMDSVLLVAASTLQKNLVMPFRKTQRPVGWTRWFVIVFAVVSAGLALNPPGDIVQITIFSGSLYAVCFFPAVVLGLHWRKGNATAALSSMVAGVVVLLLWLVAGLNAHLHEVFPALAVSVAVYWFISLKTPPAGKVLD